MSTNLNRVTMRLDRVDFDMIATALVDVLDTHTQERSGLERHLATLDPEQRSRPWDEPDADKCRREIYLKTGLIHIAMETQRVLESAVFESECELVFEGHAVAGLHDALELLEDAWAFITYAPEGMENEAYDQRITDLWQQFKNRMPGQDADPEPEQGIHYLVSWTQGTQAEVNAGSHTDHWHAAEDLEEARRIYADVMNKGKDVWSCTLSAVLQSTCYDTHPALSSITKEHAQ